MDGDKIAKIDILSHGDTAGVCNAAYDTVPGKIIDAQSTAVDAATGATVSSKAIMAAVEDALSISYHIGRACMGAARHALPFFHRS